MVYAAVLLGGIGLSLGLLRQRARGPNGDAARVVFRDKPHHSRSRGISRDGWLQTRADVSSKLLYGTLIGLQRHAVQRHHSRGTAFRRRSRRAVRFRIEPDDSFRQTVASTIGLAVPRLLVWKFMLSSRQPPRFDTELLKATGNFPREHGSPSFAQLARHATRSSSPPSSPISSAWPAIWRAVYQV